MKSFSVHGINEFVICLGYKGAVIKEYFANYARYTSDMRVDLKAGTVSYSGAASNSGSGDEEWTIDLVDTGRDTMTGGRLKRIASLIDDTFVMTYGDGVADVDVGKLVAFHRAHQKLATVTAVEPPGRFGALALNGDVVTGFAEKVDNQDRRVNAGFFVLEPQTLDLISGDATVWEQEPMTELASRRELRAYLHDGFWQPMDTPRDKRYLEELWSRPRPPWKTWS
jgi:glucose-1-phosphate cytidylyltransferase